jgi:hypothetical protein
MNNLTLNNGLREYQSTTNIDNKKISFNNKITQPTQKSITPNDTISLSPKSIALSKLDLTSNNNKSDIELEIEKIINWPTTNTDPSAMSGNIFDFLTYDDKKQLQKAYEYAKENDESFSDISDAAVTLSFTRVREASIRSGTIWASSDSIIPLDKLSDNNKPNRPESDKSELLKKAIENTDDASDTLLNFINTGLKNDTLYKSNPHLNTPLFLEAARFFTTDQLDSSYESFQISSNASAHINVEV